MSLSLQKIQAKLLKNGWEEDELRIENNKWIILKPSRKELDKLYFEAYVVNDNKVFDELKNN